MTQVVRAFRSIGDGGGGVHGGASGGDPPQFPTILNGYAARPSWQVAGVDYYVGVPSSVALTDWQGVTGTGITVTGSGVHVTSTSNVHINAVDFSLHGGGQLYFQDSPNGLVTKCNFLSSPTDSLIQTLGTSSGFTMSQCTVTGGTDGSGLLLIQGGGTVEVFNCWFRNFPQHVTEINGSATFNFHHNLISNGGTVSGAHLNYSQWQGSADTLTPTISYNTTYQTLQQATGEGFQIYTNDGTHTGTLINPRLLNNTMIAIISGVTQSMTFMVHGSSEFSSGNPAVTPISGTALADSNYFDPTGALGAWYTGSFVGWTRSNNINMVDGSALNS